jgi:hypothetical protein
MAAPNLPQEQTTKVTLRNLTRAGITPGSVTPPVDNAIMVNALFTASGIIELSVPANNTSFVISGSNGLVTTNITGTSTGNTVNQLVTALAAGPLSGTTFFVNAGGANYLNATTTSIIVPSGAILTVISGVGGTPTITAASGGPGTEANAYPNYVGAPNSTPNWVDDVTGHSYQVGYAGQLVINNNGTLSGANVVQTQIRQILTGNGPDGGSQTQQYSGYFATYSGNLTQTGQRRTYRQQS